MLKLFFSKFKLIILVLPLICEGQIFDQSDRITSELKNQLLKNTNGRHFGDNFGTATCMNDSFAVVSAIEEDEDSNGNYIINSGAIYVYKKNGTAWNLIQKLVANDRRASDKFGNKVAISGDYIIVSSEYNSYDSANNNFINKSGAVYIYKKNKKSRFEFFQKITANNREENLFFGKSISIDNNNIIVGTQYDTKDTSGSNTLSLAGAIYLFKLLNGKWIQTSKVVAFDRQASDYFGYSVSLSDSFIFVGAPNEDHDSSGSNTISNSGSVYIYTIRGNSVYFFQKINANNRAVNGQFGNTIIASGNNLIINAKLNSKAGNLYAFSFFNNRWNFTQRFSPNDLAINDEFGNAIDLHNDILISGSYLQDKDTSNQNINLNAGAAYIFEKINGIWIQVKKITANLRTSQSQFGYSCATNGIDFFVGSNYDDLDSNEKNFVPNAGSIYNFRKINSKWIQIQKIVAVDFANNDNFGGSVSFYNNYAITGVKNEDENEFDSFSIYNSGAAYILKKSNENWYRYQKITPKLRYENDEFGTSVYINDNYAFVGAPKHKLDSNESNSLLDAGAVYIFNNINGKWIQTQKIVAPDRSANAIFGTRIFNLNNTLLISAPVESKDSIGLNDVSYAGAIYLYELMNNRWVFKQKLTHNDRNVNDQLGYSMDMNDSTIIAGSWHNSRDSIGQNVINGSGAVYIFKKNNNRWIQSQKIVAADRQQTDLFGMSCAIDKKSRHIVVGAYFKHIIPGTYKYEGASYIFKEINNQFIQIAKLLPNDSIKTNLLFGSHVDIDEDIIIISSTKSLYSYKIDSLSNIKFIQTISGKNPKNDLLSGVFQFNNNTIILGSPTDPFDSTGQNHLIGNGAVYFFTKTCNFISNDTASIVACYRFKNSKNNLLKLSGIYNDTFINYLGCDSIITFDLKILNPTYDSIIVMNCNSFLSPSKKLIYTQSGTYIDTIQNFSGCDSFITINLTIINKSFDSISVTKCNSYTSPSKKNLYTSSGTYIDTIPNYIGCDSIITINLTILNKSYDSLNIATCNSYNSPSKKYIYTSSGTYIDTIPNYFGCDSIITINLTILNKSYDSLNIAICNSYSSPSRKYIYTSSGKYIDTIPNYFGCDSIITINYKNNGFKSSIVKDYDTLKAFPKNSIYQWYKCDTIFIKLLNETNENYIPKNKGKYSIVVTSNNCKDTSSCIDFNSTSIINKNYTNFSIMPNPASDFISVFGLKHQIISKVSIYNFEGKILKNIYDNFDKIDVSFLSNGFYFIQIRTETKDYNSKILIMN